MSGFLDGLGILGIIGIVAGTFMKNDAVDAQKQSIELEAKQQQLEFQQKTLNNISATTALIGKQVTTALGSNLSPASPSVTAMVKQTYNVGQQNQKNLQDESNAAQAIAKAKESALDSQSGVNIISGLADAASVALMTGLL